MSESETQRLEKLMDEVLLCLRGPVGDAEHSGLVGMVAALRRDMEDVRNRLAALEDAHLTGPPRISKAKAGAILGGLGALLAALGTAAAWIAEWVGNLEWLARAKGGQ